MSEFAEKKQPGRGPGRQFQRGKSGNPRGKPKGTRARATMMAEKLMLSDAKEIVASVIGAAKTGDMTAARLVLDRIVPLRKGRPLSIALPPISSAADVTTALSAIVAQMAQGEITPDEAAIAASVIETKRKALETEELDRRLSVIEQQLAKRK